MDFIGNISKLLILFKWWKSDCQKRRWSSVSFMHLNSLKYYHHHRLRIPWQKLFKVAYISNFPMWLCSTCGSLRGRPRSLLFDPGGRPPRLLSLLQEVNLLGSFLASRDWPPCLLSVSKTIKYTVSVRYNSTTLCRYNIRFHTFLHYLLFMKCLELQSFPF